MCVPGLNKLVRVCHSIALIEREHISSPCRTRIHTLSSNGQRTDVAVAEQSGKSTLRDAQHPSHREGGRGRGGFKRRWLGPLCYAVAKHRVTPHELRTCNQESVRIGGEMEQVVVEASRAVEVIRAWHAQERLEAIQKLRDFKGSSPLRFFLVSVVVSFSMKFGLWRSCHTGVHK